MVGRDTPSSSPLETVVQMDTPCTSTVQAVERDTPSSPHPIDCERDTLCMPILLTVFAIAAAGVLIVCYVEVFNA